MFVYVCNYVPLKPLNISRVLYSKCKALLVPCPWQTEASVPITIKPKGLSFRKVGKLQLDLISGVVIFGDAH